MTPKIPPIWLIIALCTILVLLFAAQHILAVKHLVAGISPTAVLDSHHYNRARYQPRAGNRAVSIPVLPTPIPNPQHRRALGILDLDPTLGPT
jgi:hypothetical protein